MAGTFSTNRGPAVGHGGAAALERPYSTARRRGGRAVECTGLENRRPGSPRSAGSNPAPSASGAEFGSTAAFAAAVRGIDAAGDRSALDRLKRRTGASFSLRFSHSGLSEG